MSQPATLLKQKFVNSCFPVNFVKFLRTFFFIEHILGLLLQRSTEHRTAKLETKWKTYGFGLGPVKQRKINK